MDRKEAISYVKSMKKSGKMDRDIRDELVKDGFDPIDAGDIVLKAPNEPDDPEPKEEKGPMTIRSPFLVALLGIFTLGIYSIYWLISTSKELSKRTESSPNPWFLLGLIIPGINFIIYIIYSWKYTGAVSEFVGSERAIPFIFMVIFAPIGNMMCQMDINKRSLELMEEARDKQSKEQNQK